MFLVGCDNKKDDAIETNITDEMNQKIDSFIKVLQLKYVNVSNEDLSENEKLYYAFNIASDGFHSKYVSKEDINKTMIELFGEKVNYKNHDIKSIYTDETVAYFMDDKYVYNYNTAHGVIRVKGYSKEVSRERKNDVIKVEIKRVYMDCGDTCPVFAIYKDPEYKEEYDVSEKYWFNNCYMCESYEINVEDYVRDNLDTIPTLILEFKLEGDNPVFSRLYK
jgi:hypothetical protein